MSANSTDAEKYEKARVPYIMMTKLVRKRVAKMSTKLVFAGKTKGSTSRVEKARNDMR